MAKGGLLLVGFLRSQDSPASPSFNFSVWLICSRTNDQRRVKNRLVTEYKLLSKKRFIVYVQFYIVLKQENDHSVASWLFLYDTTNLSQPLNLQILRLWQFLCEGRKRFSWPDEFASKEGKKTKQNKARRPSRHYTVWPLVTIWPSNELLCLGTRLLLCWNVQKKKKSISNLSR